MEFTQKKGAYFAKSGIYKICWSGGKPPFYWAYAGNELLLATNEKNAAKKACNDHSEANK